MTVEYLSGPKQLEVGSTKHALVWHFVAIIVGGLFVYAGILKALDPVRFAGDIENFHIIPWPIGVRLAFYLPWLEILCGIGLFVRQLRTGALAILTALTTIFIVASIAAKARGIDVTCGCFGAVSKGMPFSVHLALDFAILAALVWLWRTQRPLTNP